MKRIFKDQKLVLRYLGWILIGLLLGCADSPPAKRTSDADRKSETSSGSGSQRFSNSLTGEEILQQLIARYGGAQTYRDRAVLHLNYRLLGKPIKEPHPFSLVWQANQRIAGRIFKGQFNSDSQLLSCYVYDIQSGNLDGQQLFLPVSGKLPLELLYQDSIVRHYLGGYADLPLDETEKDFPPKLIPPTLSLLTGQHPFGWIQSPDVVERLPDRTLDQQNCYVIRSMYRDMTADIWIDQTTNLLVQISLPLKIMDRQVVTSTDIADVELTIKFHQAEMDIELTEQEQGQFAVGLKNQATPVRKFIKIPDPFPSEKIGQMSPRFDLVSADGRGVDQLHFDGRPTILLWLSGMEENRLKKTIIPELEKMLASYPRDSVAVGLLYSETELANGSTQKLIDPWATILPSTGWPLYYDQQLQVAGKFQLKAMPVAVIMDRNSRIEFVCSLADENGMVDLQAALQRIVRGESIAGEMKRDYEKFVASYHQQLEAVTARSLLGLADPAGQMAKPQSVVPTGEAATLTPKLVWKKEDLRQPGNLVVDHWVSPPRIYVLDGWRTVVQLDIQGNEVARNSLDLPPGAAVSCLRIASQPEPNRSHLIPQFAAFSVQGERVYLFNQNWESLAPLPVADFVHEGIRDVQFLPTDDGTSLRQDLVVSFSHGLGSYRFDLSQKTMSLISRKSADSLAVVLNQIWYAGMEGFGLLQDDQQEQTPFPGGQFQKISALDPIYRPHTGMLVLTQADRENNWSLAKITSENQIAWSQPIGSQLFNHEIEPVASCQVTEDQVIWGVADVFHRVTLISGGGQYLGQLNAHQPLTGIGMYASQGSPFLIVALEQGVVCYRLGSTNLPAIQVSNQAEK